MRPTLPPFGLMLATCLTLACSDGGELATSALSEAGAAVNPYVNAGGMINVYAYVNHGATNFLYGTSKTPPKGWTLATGEPAFQTIGSPTKKFYQDCPQKVAFVVCLQVPTFSADHGAQVAKGFSSKQYYIYPGRCAGIDNKVADLPGWACTNKLPGMQPITLCGKKNYQNQGAPFPPPPSTPQFFYRLNAYWAAVNTTCQSGSDYAEPIGQVARGWGNASN